jgi:hypothetical protein
MSREASDLAWELPAPRHGARLVLLALADAHNETTGRCFPSVARLSKRTCLERKAVMRAIAALRSLGLISTERYRRGLRYILHFIDQSQNGTGDRTVPVTKEACTSPKMGCGRSQNVTHNQERTGKESGNGAVDASLERLPAALNAASAPLIPLAKENLGEGAQKLKAEPSDDGLNEFLREYPKRIAAKQLNEIRKAWRRTVIDPANVVEILADVRFRKTTDDWKTDGGRYVPSPIRYLEERRWDEPMAVIRRLTHEVERHPGNHDSTFHDLQATPAVVADFKAKRSRLRELQKGQP